MSPKSVLFAIPLGAALCCAPTSHAEPLDEVQKLASEWVRLRAESSRLEMDWSTEKTLLQGSIQALETRLTGLEETRQAVLAAGARERGEQGDTSAHNADAALALTAAETRLQGLSSELTRLRSSLPPRLSLALELPFRSLAGKELSSGERMHFVMTIINRCIQFNRVITYSEEAVALEGEKEGRLLRVLYWGLAQAYALDTASHRAYAGRPVGQAWKWEPLPDSADQVATLFAVYNEKADPQYVPIPTRIGGLTSKPAEPTR